VHETDELIDRVATTLRHSTIDLSGAFDARVMMRVRTEAHSPRRAGLWTWLRQPRSISISPLGALAMAAGVAALVVVAAQRDGTVLVSSAPTEQVAAFASHPEQMTKFVFVSASAANVAIVGDFNDWEADGMPLNRLQDGVWTITIPLAPGRYQYTFVVDGTWVADPLAPRTLEDDFGQPNSVITVGDVST
jgi:hypothetical protein